MPRPDTNENQLIRFSASSVALSERRRALQAAAGGEPAAAEGETAIAGKRFSIVAYTGDAIVPLFWFSRVVVDLKGIRLPGNQIPILIDHCPRLDAIFGQTDKIEVGSVVAMEGDVLEVTDAAKTAVALATAGFKFQASIGLETESTEFVEEGVTVTVNGREFVGPLRIVRQGLLKETSVVVLGADAATSATVGNSEPNQTASAALDDEETDPEDPEEEYDMSATPPNIAASAGNTPTPAPTNPRMIEARRVEGIKTLCGSNASIAARAISEGWDLKTTQKRLDKARRQAEIQAGRPEAPPVMTGAATRPSIDAGAISAALCLSAGIEADKVGKWYGQAATDKAMSKEIRGAGMRYLLYATIHAAGLHARPDRVDNDVIRTAFQADQMLRASSGGFSSISLSGILGDVANKRLLASYTRGTSIIPEIAYQSEVPDFKTFNHYRLTGSGALTEVGKDGELKAIGLQETHYTNRLKTYGGTIALTREMMINDDLNAFLGIPDAMGALSFHVLEKLAITKLLANTGDFFGTGNANLLTGAGSALGVAGVNAAVSAFRTLTDANGNPISINPTKIVVPPALEATANQLYKSTTVNETTTANKQSPNANPHAGLYKPVVSSWLAEAMGLSGASNTAWYLAADPSTMAAILQVAYLTGQRSPVIESGETSFDTLGMQWRTFFDFGINLFDEKSAVKNAGA